MSIKKQFKWFTIFEYEKEQDYLREKHKAGWKFIKVKGLGTCCFENLKNQKHLLNPSADQFGERQSPAYQRLVACPEPVSS